MEWIEVRSSDSVDEDIKAEQERWEAVAEDVALIPDKVVKVEEEKGTVKVFVHVDLYGFFQQGMF